MVVCVGFRPLGSLVTLKRGFRSQVEAGIRELPWPKPEHRLPATPDTKGPSKFLLQYPRGLAEESYWTYAT